MTTPTTRTALVNGRILSSSGTLEAVADGTWAEADRVVIDGDHIAEVHLPGTTHAASADVTEDLEGRFVLPDSSTRTYTCCGSVPGSAA